MGQRNAIEPAAIQLLIERIAPVQKEDLDYEALYDLLVEYYQNPLDINRVSREELEGVFLLNPIQIQEFLDHRNQFGDFLSIFELQSLTHWDSISFQTIRPFLTLDSTKQIPKSFFERLAREENAQLTLRYRRTLELRRGFQKDSTLSPKNRYLGDPNELLIRFRIQHTKDFSLGFTLEKDAGEALAWSPKTNRYGFDFGSFHLTKYNQGKWKTLSIGDFKASFGQGLVFGAGFNLGKGAETVPTVRRSSLGILPYTAGLESGFFRGVGLTRIFGSWKNTLILSYLKRDGRVANHVDTLDDSNREVTSISQTGLHRTENELSTKHQVQETNLGTNLQYNPKKDHWSAGINLLYTQLNIPWNRSVNRYNLFEFSGSKNILGSMYVNVYWKNFSFFGESAKSISKGQGTVLGFVSSLSKAVDFSILWRRYDPHFHSFYATSFSEGTRPTNERGTYLGLQLKFSKHIKLNTYLDIFQFPWLKFRVYAPSHGQEWLARLSYQPKKNLLASLQVKQESKMRNTADEASTSSTYNLVTLLKSQVQASLHHEISPELTLQSRVLVNQVTLADKVAQGWMIFQDISFKHDKFKVTARMALFDADTYDNRLYVYEHNALGTLAIPSFSGKGSRQYLLIQYRIHPKLSSYFRIAQTYYANVEEISSGIEQIQGSKKSDVVVALRYQIQ